MNAKSIKQGWQRSNSNNEKAALDYDFQMTVYRPPGAKTGIDVQPVGNGLTIVAMMENGVLPDYNVNKINPGDKIVSVNGVSGDPDAMLQQFNRDMISLGVTRASPTESNVRSSNKGSCCCC